MIDYGGVTVRAAGVFFISNERYAKRASRTFLDVAPDLIVEMLSPEDRWGDVMRKLADYFEAGVRGVWVVDGSLGSVFAYRSLTDVKQFTGEDVVSDEDIRPGFSLPLADVFRE